MRKYDWLIVGSGLFGATFAHLARKDKKKCLVIDRRNVLGGNVYCELRDGIYVHKYGCHVFHTDDKMIWDFVNGFVEFEPFILQTMANYNNKMFNLPFNMNTFHQMWGVNTPREVEEILGRQRLNIPNPRNLEEQALALVGRDVYETLIKGYTEKQWGRKCIDLPPSIIRRIPIRLTYNNNYFNDKYQGIPKYGYNALIDGLLDGIECMAGVDYIKERELFDGIAQKILYTGQIDEFFDYRLGCLKYRSVRFEEVECGLPNFQGCPVMNHTDLQTPYTRCIEHKHFDRNCDVDGKTIISLEYSMEWEKGIEPYYPINDIENDLLYSKYKGLAKSMSNVFFGGRLGDYKYYDMDDAIGQAMKLYDDIK